MSCAVHYTGNAAQPALWTRLYYLRHVCGIFVTALGLSLPRGAEGHGLTVFVRSCDGAVTTSCCDLSKAPETESGYHKEPDFGRTIFPNVAFARGTPGHGDSAAPQVYLADLGVSHRGSVWDATNPECADGDGDESPPSPCWRFEPDASDFPAFTPFRCSKDDSFSMFSINAERPLEYWDGSSFVAPASGERLRIYVQDWPEPSVLEEEKNELGAGKWAAVLGASVATPRALTDGAVLGRDVPDEQVVWTAAGNAKGSESPHSYYSSFEKDLSWGEDENWVDTTAGWRWGDHEHYLYRLVDSKGEPCNKGTEAPSVGADIGADAGDQMDGCANGVYLLTMSVTVDGKDSDPIYVLFARGVDMTGPAMQDAFASLQRLGGDGTDNGAEGEQLKALQKSAATGTVGGDGTRIIAIAGLTIACVAVLL